MEVIERMMPVGKAAGLLGIDARTLRRWLEDERGLAIRRLGHGRSPLIKISDIQAVIAKHSPIQQYTPKPRG